MYFSDNSIIYFKGEFISPKEAKGDPYSQTLHYGNGIFEGIRSYNTKEGTKIFKAKEHYERLISGAEKMEIPFEYSVDKLIELSYGLLEKNELSDAYIRPIIVASPNMGLGSPETSSLIIQCWPWAKLMGDSLLNVKTSKFQRPNPKACFVEAKVTGHYVNSILARNDAKKTGHDECILLDINENVAECSGANVFMEKDGKLYTPQKGHIMAGITRSTIMEICEEEGIEVEEGTYDLEFFKSADSAFFTGTAAEVVGLKCLDEYQFPLEWEKSLGKKLMLLYKQEVLGERKSSLSKAV